MDDATRTVVVGLDGCSWNVLEPLLETGELPNLAAMREDGASGTLESVVPFYTGAAWSSYATGVSPGAHGVYDFLMLREGGALSPATASDLRRKTYFELLGETGRRSVLVNLPLDQEDVPGAVVVNSWLTVDEARRLYPRALRGRYARELATYRNYPTTFDLDLESHLEDLCELEAARFDLGRALFANEDWDHFFILFSAPDWLGHKATGRFLAGDAAARAAFRRLYAQLDGYIGWLRRHAGEATLVVLSDHGQCEESYVVHVNGILRELGHVRLRREAATGRRKGTVVAPRSLRALRRVRLLRRLARGAKSTLARQGVELVMPIEGDDVDRVSSRAFTPTVASYAVYADESVDLAEIRERLAGQRLDDGRPAFDGVWTFEELYGVERPPGAPALVYAPALGVRPSVAVRSPLVTRAADPGRGAHQRDGMVMLAGPGVARTRLERPALYDLCPTLMWAMGEPTPAGADGRILFDAFTTGFTGSRDVRVVDAAAADRPQIAPDGEVEARLRALGYI